MTKILIYFFIGISLSMDAFSIALSLGTTNPKRKEITLSSLVVGIFHFFMPLVGNSIGHLIRNNFLIKSNYLISLLFLILAIQMFLERNKEETKVILEIKTIILMAFSVSIDSLTVGFAFGLGKEIIILASIIFMVVTSIFTYIGFQLGKRIRNKYQDKAIYLGIIIMLLISYKYLVFS